jgi:hypothetical protein
LEHPRFGFSTGQRLAFILQIPKRQSLDIQRRNFEMGNQPQNRRQKEKQNDQPDDRRRDPQRGGNQPKEPSDSSRWHSWTIG